MNYVTASAINVAVHTGFCVAFVIANDGGLTLYKHFFGEAASRGYAPGAVTRLALLLFVIASLAMALAPWKFVKAGIATAATLFIGLFLVSEHPLRALFYCLLTGVLSAVALMLAAKVVAAIDARSTAKKPGNAHDPASGMTA